MLNTIRLKPAIAFACIRQLHKLNVIRLKPATKQCAWQPEGDLERAAWDWKDIQRALLAEVKSSAYGDLDMRPTRRMS